MIQEQAKLIEEKEKEGSSDALRAKYKEIMAAAEKQKQIQEQSRVIVEKEKETKENMAAVKALKEEKSVNKSMILINITDHVMQLPVMMSKNTLRVVKSGIGFHNFRHNNIQILNLNFKILASHFYFLWSA